MGCSVEALESGLAESPAPDVQSDGSTAGAESTFAELLAEVVGVERVSVDSHFFDDLGADSMVMARFCARVRKRADLPSVSIRDIYECPTVRSLAAAVVDGAPAGSPPVVDGASGAVESSVGVAPRASTGQYLVCGALQGLVFVGYAFVLAIIVTVGYEWISAARGDVETYLRSAAFSGAGFLVVCALPVLAKWVLIGRWKPQQVRIWSLAYVRFWVVKTLVRSSPVALLFSGTPLYSLYLRALGAKVGRRAVIFSRHVPICTDLLRVGADAVIRREAFLLCYRAQAGQIETGPVTIGRGALVGERAVLDIGTSIGDGGQLGHASALHSGQAVPAGERWHGSPAQPTEVDYLRVAPARCGNWRRVSFCVTSLLALFFFYLPLAFGGLYLALTLAPSLGGLLDPGSGGKAVLGGLTTRQVFVDALAISAVVFVGGVLVGLLVVASVPRALSLLIKPDKVYPLYGLHDRIHRRIARLTNSKFLMYLFGDSSYVVHYLRWLGYDLSSRVVQTGSNFGSEVTHVTPYLSSVGSGTMIADALSILNDELSSTSFMVSRVSIGARNFFGNNIVYPAGGRTGENCLLATKVMVPLDGKVREGVGLLGSPCFEIPRSVERDGRFDHLRTGDELRRRLRAKNWYNLRTIGVFLLARWVPVFLVTLLGLASLDFYGAVGYVAIAGLFALSAVVSPLYFVLVERCLAGFRSLQPTYCSIYDPRFWLTERLWKAPAFPEAFHAFDGTPFKNVFLRLLGVRLGRRVFDDGGVLLTERTLTTIGDDCVFNAGSKVQCHSQEDGTFKSDRSTIGAGATIGVGAVVHYGVTVGDRAVLAADSFLMKGEEVPPDARWGGNPAREL